jgi:hypothetical protein
MRALIHGMQTHCALLVECSQLCRMIKDERVQQEGLRTIFDVKDAPNRLG